MRNHPTAAERKLWCFLRKRQCAGMRFHRQSPIFGWIVDFWCPACRVVVEVDGSYHANRAQAERDRYRDRVMQTAGLLVLRFTNERALRDTARVVQEIGSHASRMRP